MLSGAAPSVLADLNPFYTALVVLLFLMLAGLVAMAWMLARQRTRTAEELGRVARTHPLTRVSNLTFWNEELPKELARADRAGQPLSVAYIDIDHFGQFNERFGRQAGDALLQEAATVWRSMLPEIDVLAHLDSDTFAVILAGSDAEAATETVNRLRTRTPQGQRVSAGVAVWDTVESAADLQRRGIDALREAQRRLGNRIVVATDLRVDSSRLTDGGPPAAAAPGALGEPTVRRCAEPGCGRGDVARCAYVDRRRNRCESYYCPEHSVVIAGAPYCRRHAGVVSAVGPNVGREPLPELNNRAPSLVNWVSRDLDDDIRAMLSEYTRLGYEVKSGAVSSSLTRERQRAWRREWDLFSHTGVVLSVGIAVEEARDSVVIATVDSRPVAEVVPPWIGNRGDLSEEEEVERRLAFYRGIVEQLRPVVAQHVAQFAEQP